MQTQEQIPNQKIDILISQIKQQKRISYEKAKQFIDKVMSIVNCLPNIDVILTNSTLYILEQILQKGRNFNSRLISDIWKIFLNLHINFYCQNQQDEKFTQQQQICNHISLQSLYEFAHKKHNLEFKIKKQLKINRKIVLKIWNIAFKYTDTKTVQYAFLAVFMGWDLFFSLNQHYSVNQQVQSNSNQKDFLNSLSKSLMYFIKFSQRIKQSTTFDQFSRLLKLIQNLYLKNFNSQLQIAFNQLSSTYNMKQAINFQNLYLHVWQKIVISQLICLSKNFPCKNQNSIQIIQLLKQLKRSMFMQRLINCARGERFNKNKYTFLINPEHLEFILLSLMINLWVRIGGYQVQREKIIQNQKNKYNHSQQFIQNQCSKTQIKQIMKELPLLKSLIWQFIQILTKRQITVLVIRHLVKKLQIVNLNYASGQWRQVFILMQHLLKQYPINLNVIQFENDNSYISKKFSPSLSSFPFSISLKFKGQSIPFKEQKILIQFIDSSNKQKVLITMRNYEKNLIILNFIRVQKNMIIDKQQKQFNWNQYKTNKVQITFKNNKIKLVLNNIQVKNNYNKQINPHKSYKQGSSISNVTNCMSVQHCLKKIDQIVLCDRQIGMGSIISQLLSFKLIKYQIFQQNQKEEFQIISLFNINSTKSSKNQVKFDKCQKFYQQSFIHYLQILGYMDLFILILSHTLKKIKNQGQILQMIRSVLSLMDKFTIYKKVKQKQLTKQQKDIRRNSILCLCWFFAKQTKSVIIILELMRFLYIRGKKQTEEMLKFLCNFSYWKQFKLQHQILIVMKIREIMKQSCNQQTKIANLYFCKKLLFDMVLFMKQSQFIMEEKNNCLKLHRVILETIYQNIKDILEYPNKKEKLFFLQIIKFISFLINTISCVLNRKVSEELFDDSFSIQFTLFLRDIGKLIFIVKQKKCISKNDIDYTLEQYFRKDEKQLVLPLSLNNQDAQDERFAIFLTKIISQTKSLITIFETETYYIYDAQTKIYPIYSETSILCSQNKVVSNIISFNIYMQMLSDKSWNYLLFSMPLEEYTQKVCENLWRISFYQLFKQKKYISKLSKMLQQTPFPQSQYCLMKIFEAILSSSYFQKKLLLRLLKSSNFTKRVCPFKIQSILIKYLNRLEPEVIDTSSQNSIIQGEKEENRTRQNSHQEIARQQKIYYILFHLYESDYIKNQQLIQCLKYRKMYEQKFKIVIHHLYLQSILNLINQNLQKQINQNDKKSVSLIQRTNSTTNLNKYNHINSSIQQYWVTMADQANNSNEERSSEIQSYSKNQNQIKQNKNNQLSNFISLSLQVINFYFNQINLTNIKSFLKIQSDNEASVYVENFVINVEGIIKSLQKLQKESIYNKKINSQLSKYANFIDVYLKKFSQHLIYQKFPQFKCETSGKNPEDQAKKMRNKYLYKTIHIDLIKKSTEFFNQIMSQKRIELHILERIWNRVQKKNKFFWNLFISSQKYYYLSDITTPLGQRLLLTITNQKPKIQLPKMMNRQSVLHSVSLASDKNQPLEQSQSSSTFFQDNEIYRPDLLQGAQIKEKQRTRKGSQNIRNEPKILKFKVLMVKNDKIYQGFLYMIDRNIFRFQETYIIERLYDRICAHQKQRRNDDQVQKDPTNIDILIGASTQIFLKKYLFYNVGLQIVSYEKFYFFCFDSQKRRQRFCTFYLKSIREKIITEEKAKKIIYQDSIKWSKGFLSNYEYLMKINKYANRSPNDISQYFIMPWTVSQFEKKSIDVPFIFQAENFRDLKKPLGKIDDKKWKQIEYRFKNSFSHLRSSIQGGLGLQPFLYGSFYSNPAIITNYMIRLQPFSSLHYHLQSEKIDVADRLFFQFSDQYRSIKTNVSDVKQLIPEFYNNPQFLKNRSELNLGQRQNKQLVNDVRLPSWSENSYQFVFKMKFFLQSPLISKHLHVWIDLIFGKLAKRQNALNADNLYMSQIYGPNESKMQKQGLDSNSSIPQKHKLSQNKSVSSTQNRIPFNKQFGQIPLSLFDSNHIEFQMNEQYFFFRGRTQIISQFSFQNSENNEQIDLSIYQNFSLISKGKEMNIFEINYSQNNQKENWKNISEVNINGIINSSRIVNGQKISSLSPYLFYIKQNKKKLCCRWIKKSKIFGSLEVKDELQIMEAQALNWFNHQVLIIGNKNSLKIFNLDIHSPIPEGGKICQLLLQQSKPSILVKQFPVFTQHKSQIILIEVNNDLKLILTLDEMSHIFLLKYYPNKIELINNFDVKNCYFEQKIKQIILHKMSLIIIRTNYNRLLVYNFYGDLIGAKQLFFKQQGDLEEILTCMKLYNKQSAELIIGTNKNNIWKIDIFEFLKSQQQIDDKPLWSEKISLPVKKNNSLILKNVFIKRIGRHWQIYSVTEEKGRFCIYKTKSLTSRNSLANFHI